MGNPNPKLKVVKQDPDAQQLVALVGTQRRQLAVASALGAAASAIWIPQAFLLARATGALVSGSLDHAGMMSAAIAFIALAVLKVACEISSGVLASAAAETVQLRTRERILQAIASSSPLDATRPHSGETAAAVTHHVEALAPYLLRYQHAKMRVALVPAAILVAVVPISWLAALVLLVSAPLIPIFMALIGGRARSASLQQLRQIGSMNAFLLDRLQGLTTVRVFDAVERTAEGLRAVGERIHRTTMSVLRIAFLSSAVLELFAALGVASVAVYVGFNLLGYITIGSHGAPLTLFGGLFVLLLAPEFFQPLREFAAAYHDRAAGLSASWEIGRILNSKSPQLLGSGDRDADLPQPSIIPSIAVCDVSLDLNPDRPAVFRNISLAIRPGEHVALIGPSGSGKSMLLGIMAGLIAPSAGTVSVGGIRLTHGTADRWRQQIAWVGQRPSFVRASLKANLLLGRTSVQPLQLQSALDRLAAQTIVEKLPKGLATVLGENGEGISGGEAQRCALVRAALADADVIFADEPTEHLDVATAKTVIAGLLDIAQGRTLVVATHDRRLVNNMHRVIDVGVLNERRHHHMLAAAE